MTTSTDSTACALTVAPVSSPISPEGKTYVYSITLENTLAALREHVKDTQRANYIHMAMISLQLCGYAGLDPVKWREYQDLVYRHLPHPLVMLFTKEWCDLFPRYIPGTVDQKIHESQIRYRGPVVQYTAPLLPWML